MLIGRGPAPHGDGEQRISNSMPSGLQGPEYKSMPESRGGMVSEHWSRAAEMTQQLRAFAAFVEGLGLEREGIR